jgi:hypothetical protein
MIKILVFIALLIVAVGGYIAIGPFIAVHEIRTAIENQDSEKLAEYVDFPELRTNLKEQFDAYIMQRATTELKDNPFGVLGMALAGKMVEGMVDSFVTPAGLSRIAAGRRSQGAEGSPQEKAQPFKNARYTYDSTSKFSAWVPGEDGDEIRFAFARSGLSWKLTNIIVPLGAESTQPASANRADIPAAVNAAGSLKIEAIDTRATETNDVWARYAWKLSVSNAGDGPTEFSVRIEWQDADGFVIDEDEENGLALGAHESRTFTGDKLIDYPAASRVSKVEANLAR